MRLYLQDASTSQHHNIQRTWLLAWIIDRTKSIQRGRIPTIQLRIEENIQWALDWADEEPDTLFQVMYAELLNVTSKTLEQLSTEHQDRSLVDRSLKLYGEFTKSWLIRFQEKTG